MNAPRLMLHIPATGELLDPEKLRDGEVIGLNDAGLVLQWKHQQGITTPSQTPQEFGMDNLKEAETRRVFRATAPFNEMPPVYPLDPTDKNTVLAALQHYHEDGLGEPFKRSNEVHALAAGEADDQQECISLDQGGVEDLLARLRKSPGIDLSPISQLRAFAQEQDDQMCDPHGDGSGNASRPPTGDDWNDLYAEVMGATEVLNRVG